MNEKISDDTIRKIVNYIGKIIYENDCKKKSIEILNNLQDNKHTLYKLRWVWMSLFEG